MRYNTCCFPKQEFISAPDHNGDNGKNMTMLMESMMMMVSLTLDNDDERNIDDDDQAVLLASRAVF